MMEMNMTPLIDVMLVLIIMLIITIPIQNHAINLRMPSGNPPPPLTQPVVVNIDVDPAGTVLWNGTPITSRHELEVKMQGVATLADQPELHLRPDRKVAYKYVASVMALAQRLGVTKIGIVGNEQFIND